MQLHPLPLSGPLLVLARDQLADQAEREELEPHDHQQHPEDQQRPLSDRISLELEHGQVEEHSEAGHAEQQPEPAEEVQRAVAVTPDERDREQIEEPA